MARACPGEIINAQYVARLADGSTAALGRDDVASLVRKSDQAEPSKDGAWQLSLHPLAAVFTGYKLSATLASDSSVHADTVVAPAPECKHAVPDIGLSGRYNERSAHVRIGVMSTPFFDSVAVAVIEPDGGAAWAMVLSPSEMKSGAIRVVAMGLTGKSGRSGRQGNNGGECESGSDGDDGEPGEPGHPGGKVDIIVQTDAPWLAQLISVSNPGGRGGDGGVGGQGGSAGFRVAGRASCSPRRGRNGRNGNPGSAGSPGPAPEVTSVPFALLWPGSPIWSDAVAQRSLEALMQYTSQRAR